MDINKIIKKKFNNKNDIREIEKEYNKCINDYNLEIQTCDIYKNIDLCKQFTFNNFKYCIFNIKK